MKEKLEELRKQKTVLATNMEKKEIILSTTILRNDIHKCLSDLVSARVNRDRIQEEGALFKMESLMVSATQLLDCIIDCLKEDIE